MGDERRVHRRAELRSRATVFVGDKRASVPALDVSEGGLALRCPTPTPIGTFVRVTFRLSDATDRWLDADGIIRDMSPSVAGEFRYGIQFVSPSPGCLAQVRDYVGERRPKPVETPAPVKATPERQPSATGLRAVRPSRSVPADRSDPALRQLYRKALDDID